MKGKKNERMHLVLQTLYASCTHTALRETDETLPPVEETGAVI